MLAEHIFDNIPVSGIISVFEHLQMKSIPKNSSHKLKLCDKQILFFCNELDKYLNTDHQLGLLLIRVILC